MGNSTFEHGNLYEILLCSLHTFCNGCGNLTGFAKTITYHTLSITYNNDCGESESATTLGHLNNSIDSNQSILQFFCVYVYSVCHNL